LIALLGLQGSAAFASVCAATPEAAVRLAGVKASAPIGADNEGYRVTGVRWDPVLQQNWVTVVSCGHPEWPGILLRTGETRRLPTVLSTPAQEEHVPLVRAGDIVELWRQEDRLRIEVGGVAEQSGSLGETIRVRLLRQQGSSQSAEEQFNGIVRGPADVEMQR